MVTNMSYNTIIRSESSKVVMLNITSVLLISVKENKNNVNLICCSNGIYLIILIPPFPFQNSL